MILASATHSLDRRDSSVEFMLALLASGMSEAEILEDYSHITQADIRACLRSKQE